MEKENKASSAEAGEEKKVIRRGVGQSRGTNRLKFDTRDAKTNGLFLAHLESVDVKTITIGEDTTGMPSFNGLEIPKIMLTFASNEEDALKRKYVTLSFNAVESNAVTIPGGDQEWKVNQVFDYFKHILNVYLLKGREFTEEEEAALSLTFEDFDEQGNYVPVEAEEVIVAWKQLFENFASIMNTGKGGNPLFKSKEGRSIAIWIKLLRYVKNNKKGWVPVSNGDLEFPRFVGEGVIELYVPNAPVGIRLDVIREDIKPRQDVAPKTPNMPGMAGGVPGFGAGVPVPDAMMTEGAMPNVDLQAAEDLPF